MRTARVFGLVAIVTAAALSVTGVQADPGAAEPADLAAALPSAASLAAERLLQAAADAPVTVTRDAGGLAHAVGTTAGHPVALPAGAVPALDGGTASAEAMARAHLARLGALFGLADQAAELRLEPAAVALAPAGLVAGADTDRILRFQQLVGGVPVLGGELVVVLDSLGALRSITGETLASAGLAPAPAPAVTAAEARATALAAVARANPDVRAGTLRAAAPERWRLDPALIGFPAAAGMKGGEVWRTEVTDRGSVRELVLVDARHGGVPLQLDLIAHLNRAVCDRNNTEAKSANGSDCEDPVRSEGGGSRGGDVDLAYDNTKVVSNYFSSAFGVDVTKLLGVTTKRDAKQRLRSTVRFCPPGDVCDTTAGILFSNAFWNGRGMFYGADWPRALDIIGHEIAHGYTEKTSRLLYLYQSGAINESMSDIFGELIDMANDPTQRRPDWMIGEDSPLQALRNMANPTTFGEPDRMTSPLWQAPDYLTESGLLDLGAFDSGAVHTNSGVGNKAAYLIATGGSFNGQSITGIGTTRTAKLYDRVQRMLTSGADYADLGVTLRQACSDLVGKSGFSTTTCLQVTKAVAATEMAKQPADPDARTFEAGTCPSGTSRSTVFSDSFEKFSTKTWSLGGQWLLVNDYAKTGTNSIFGVEPDNDNPAVSPSSATLRKTIAIPKGVKSYLRFAHQYRLEHSLLENATNNLVTRYYDGARVEYRVGSGGWKSASGLSWENGPTKTIQPDPGSAYKGFGGDSRGYGSSRLDVSFLAGKKAQFRWTILGDSIGAVDGWTVDDVTVIACGKGKPSNVASASATGKSKSVAVRWTAPAYVSPGGVTKYKVVRTGGKQGKKTTTVSGKKRSVTFRSLKKGRKYAIAITPRSKGGNGPKTVVKAKAK